MKAGIVIALVALVAAYLFLNRLSDTFMGAAKAELESWAMSWNRANTNSEFSAERFMTNAPSYIVMTNHQFRIGNSNYVSLFAHTRLGFEGTLFITTNKTFIFQTADGSVELIRK